MRTNESKGKKNQEENRRGKKMKIKRTNPGERCKPGRR